MTLKPSPEDLENLPHVHMASSDEWNPHSDDFQEAERQHYITFLARSQWQWHRAPDYSTRYKRKSESLKKTVRTKGIARQKDQGIFNTYTLSCIFNNNDNINCQSHSLSLCKGSEKRLIGSSTRNNAMTKMIDAVTSFFSRDTSRFHCPDSCKPRSSSKIGFARLIQSHRQLDFSV